MTRRRPLLLPFLALLLAVRALVPAGWMPAAGEDGVRITLCTGQGLQTVTLDADGKLRPGDPAHGGQHDPCPYGALGHAAAAPGLPELAEAPAAPPEIRVAQPAERLGGALHAPRPPSRGPPVFV